MPLSRLLVILWHCGDSLEVLILAGLSHGTIADHDDLMCTIVLAHSQRRPHQYHQQPRQARALSHFQDAKKKQPN